MPDTYQGSEDWMFALVDPDNRRPVAFDRLAQRLEEVDRQRTSSTFGPATVAEWLDQWANGDIKRHVVSTLLTFRRDTPELWLDGEYRPLATDVSVDAAAMAFARSANGMWVLTVTGLRTARLPEPWPVGSVWATSRVLLPADAPAGAWRDLLTGAELKPIESASERWLFLAQALQTLPVAVLVPATS